MNTKIKWFVRIAAVLLVLTFFPAFSQELPVKPPEKEGYAEVEAGIETRSERGISNLFHHRQLYNAITGGDNGLYVDLTSENTLLVGAQVESRAIYGRVYYGPYPFEASEAAYAYKRFRGDVFLSEGKAFLPMGSFLEGRQNSEDWSDRGVLAVRFDLYVAAGDGDYYLGIYDTYVRFRATGEKKKRFEKLNTVLEGPFVNFITSDNPRLAVISFRTAQPVKAAVVLDSGSSPGRGFSGVESAAHEIPLTGLEPDQEYRYYITYDDFKSKTYTFRTAPAPGAGDEVIFAYTGDGRAGVGGGDRFVMGVNHATLERLANFAYRQNSRLFIFGGDLINGNTASPADYRTQMRSWKEAMSGYWNHRPVYTCIGNHESLLRIYKNAAGEPLRMDRWPYDKQSSEAVFAEELTQPLNAPVPKDPLRPSYRETAYSFQYGFIQFIAFNNNYWVTKSLGADPVIAGKMGGCPEGYILPEQMDWLESELKKADANPTVKYVILFAQEPVFPNGGHTGDAMWYHGDNSVRAFTWNSAENRLIPEKEGIIEVRNRLVRLMGASKKVAAVLGSDEHAYHKILIDKNTPVGVPGTDNPDLNGRVCADGGSCSPLPDLKYPVWYMVSGGAGAPYYSEEPTPWNTFRKQNPALLPEKLSTSPKGGFYYSSQENIMIFKAGKKTVSVTVYNPYGDVIDAIDDLMNVKK